MTNEVAAPGGYDATVGGDIDIAELTELIIATQTAIDGSSPTTESFVKMLVEAPDIDREHSVLVLRTTGTRVLAGFGLHHDREPHVESITNGWVHPLHNGQGLGDIIVRWGLERARTCVASAPIGARVTNRCWASDADTAAAELFESLGYRADRHDIEMELVFDGPVTVAPLPQGITVRTMSGTQDLPIVASVVTEAFRDHYGWVESSPDQAVERWENFRSMDEWDDDLVFIARAGAEAVGVLVGLASHGAVADAGFIGSLGVVRSWRGMGLARALLTMAFDRYHRAGMRSVVLDVDADSLTGATRLYRSVGMEPVRSETTYLIELRPGIDLVRR